MLVLIMELSEVVDSLEHNVRRLLAQREELNQIKKELEAEVDELQTQKLQLEKTVEEWKLKAETLKHANSMLGSDQYKRETKLKINALIREIDQCIVQLSS